VLFVGYALFVVAITLTPQMPGSGTVARTVNRVLAALHNRGLPLSIDYLTIEFIGNILMFIPLGVFMAMLVSHRHWWVLLFTGTLMSGFIELTQLLFLPSRYPEVRDLISNSTGFLLGALGPSSSDFSLPTATPSSNATAKTPSAPQCRAATSALRSGIWQRAALRVEVACHSF